MLDSPTSPTHFDAESEQGALIDILYDNKEGHIPRVSWERRERWAKQIVQGLSNIHEAGFVQGDFMLSNIVNDENNEAQITDINRRGCPVGWESPETVPLVSSEQRLSMYIVKSDLYQLGMVLWALAMEQDKPERQPRPLSLDDAEADVPSPPPPQTALNLQEDALNLQEEEGPISDTASYDDAIDEILVEPLKEKRILNLSMNSRDKKRTYHARPVQVEAKNTMFDESQLIAAQWSDVFKCLLFQPPIEIKKQLLHPPKYREAFLASQNLYVRSSMRHLIRDAKIKRGLPGFVNGFRASALADTGAAQNIVSAAFVQEKGLSIKGNQGYFKLGNSKIAQSIGTVSLRWAFSEKPKEIIDIICHVLPQCAYDLILGSKFLTDTKTFSKHRSRLVDCVFSVFNVPHLNFLDGGRQSLDGKVGGYQVFAIPDTGAERNVMDLDYAETLGFKINARPEDRGLLQFADGTFQETVGRVKTTWTFASGLKIPVTFEVLENCSADVILGEEVLWEHDVFRSHAASIHEKPYENGENELLDLAPFSYMGKWQQKTSDFKSKILSKFNKWSHREDPLEDETFEDYEAEERDRRDHWHHQYGFEGENASPAEKEAEARRKRRYDARIEAFRRRPPCPGTTAPLISSIPTAPNDASANPTAPGTGRRRAPALIPSIPTAPNDAPIPLATTHATRTADGIPRSPAIVAPRDEAPSYYRSNT